MSVEKGVWLGDNQKEVDKKIQNLDADGNFAGSVTGLSTGVIDSSSTVLDPTFNSIVFLGLDAPKACTLAANPEDGHEIIIWSDGEQVATVEYDDYLQGLYTATFNDAGPGAVMRLVSRVGQWIVLSSDGVTFS